MTAKEKAILIVKALEEKLARDIEVIDIQEISLIADYFVIASATNSSQMNALVDAVEDTGAKEHFSARKPEGSYQSGWALMDCGDVIVHLFSEKERSFYDLEHIWRDGKRVEL